MKFKLDAEIKPGEWLAFTCFVIIVILMCKGKIEIAIQLLTQWIRAFKG